MDPRYLNLNPDDWKKQFMPPPPAGVSLAFELNLTHVGIGFGIVVLSVLLWKFFRPLAAALVTAVDFFRLR